MDSHLNNGRCVCIPFLSFGTAPGSQERETNFSLHVKIRVKSYVASTSGSEGYLEIWMLEYKPMNYHIQQAVSIRILCTVGTGGINKADLNNYF